MRRTPPRRAALVMAVALSTGGCAAAETEPAPTAMPTPDVVTGDHDGDGETNADADAGGDDDADTDGGADEATIAVADVPEVVVRSAPGGEVLHTLVHPREVGAPLTFLVDREDDAWLEVLLPVRPNGTTGWVAAADVQLFRTPFRIEVFLSEHRLVVHDGDHVRVETAIGVGGDGTPTPPGRYYVTELLEPPDPTGPYGPYAFGLSGFSEVHLDFAGGEGVIGIHGTDDPSSIGRDVSNGCIRLANDDIVELATFLPLGAPVTIHP